MIDPMETDDEFKERIYQEYADKPTNYEEQFTKGRCMTANHQVARRRAGKVTKNARQNADQPQQKTVSNIEKWHNNRKTAKTAKESG